MLARRSSIQRWWPVALLPWICLLSPLHGQEGLRRIRVGDTMPGFSLSDANGMTVHYEGRQARVLAVVILQAKQDQLERLVSDIEALVQRLRLDASAFDCIGVMSGPGASEYLRSRDADGRNAFPILMDPNSTFWGELGVVAAPTAVVVGADHKVQWIKAGYGYDFIAGFHAQLSKALGLGSPASTSEHVGTLENSSARARRDRHIQLARALARKGRLESAIAELEKVRALDPNAVDVALELGEVLCRAGKNEAVLKMAAQIKAQSSPEKAHVLMICAWARRQMGELDAAGLLLTQALALDPESPRILYESGKVHQAQGDVEKALACYRRALAEVFADGDAASSSQKRE